MDTAKQFLIAMKEKNKSHVGYGLQKESEDLISHILQNLARSELPPFKAERKNAEDSVRFREEGNQQFVTGDDIDAIESYTMSLAYADDDELMAYAHANRSAALYRKGMYKECLIDVDAALTLGYPAEKRKKLKERAARALEEIEKSSTVNGNNVEVATNGDGTVLPETLPRPDHNVIAQSPADAPKLPRYQLEEGAPTPAHGPSEEAPAASAGVRIGFSPKFGRHLVATRNFYPGDVVSVEAPFACIIYQERFYTHCHYCLSRSYNLTPCSRCPIALYCSARCRDLAWSHAHRTECSILPLLSNLLNVDTDKFRMLMKILKLLIVATRDGKGIEELRRDMKIAESCTDDRTAGFTDRGALDSTSARSALSLATNMTTRPLIGISAFACISALAAMLLATQTNFFGERYTIERLQKVAELDDVRFCGSVMLRACVITSCNCFSLQQEPGIKSGSGLYVLHSLYNHSCAPNTFRHFENLTMITRALEPIRPGDQIFTCYGADYAYMPRAERKKKLMEEYFFDCQCPACVFDWPTYKEIIRDHVGSISRNKSLVEKLKPFKQRLLANKYDIDAVKRVLQLLDDEVARPCEEIVHATQFLKCYYLDP